MGEARIVEQDEGVRCPRCGWRGLLRDLPQEADGLIPCTRCGEPVTTDDDEGGPGAEVTEGG